MGAIGKSTPSFILAEELLGDLIKNKAPDPQSRGYDDLIGSLYQFLGGVPISPNLHAQHP